MKMVSIIVPCFNDGMYIGQAIDSIMGQTYSNLEIIVIDDASTDDLTKSALTKLPKKVKVVNLEVNGGPGRARNYGISIAKGDYVLCLDADDRIDLTYIEKAVKILNDEPEIGIVYCKAKFFGEMQGPFPLPEFSIGEMLIENIIFISAVFRRVQWENIGGFDERMKGREDWDFWLSMIERGVQVKRIDEVLFEYRIRKNSRDTLFVKQDVDALGKQIYEIRMKHVKLYENHLEEFLFALSKWNPNRGEEEYSQLVIIFHRLLAPFRKALGKIVS